MSRKASQLIDDIAECSDFNYIDLETISSNKDIKKLKEVSSKNKRHTKKNEDIDKKTPQGTAISTISVPAECNFCHNMYYGTLIDYCYQPDAKLCIPFIEYNCPHCGKVGKRAVVKSALPPDEFNKRYFR